MATSRSESGYAKGCSSTVFTIEKIAVVAPMPSASVSIAMAVNVLFRSKAAKRIADVLQGLLQPLQRTLLPVQFRNSHNIAAGSQRGYPSFERREVSRISRSSCLSALG